MMLTDLPSEFWEFVQANSRADVSRLRLRCHGDSRQWLPLALSHIECLQKAGKKFIDASGQDFTPSLMCSPLSVEQATGADVAVIHARIVGTARRILDMTCGLGMDTAMLARDTTSNITAIEQQPKLAEITAYNLRNNPNVNVICGDSVAWLADYQGEPFDWNLLDPARRDSQGARVFNLHQCAPDITALLSLLRQKTHKALVKLSPMLDITQTLRDLTATSQLHVIDSRGECKEICAILDFTSPPPQNCPIILHGTTGVFKYEFPGSPTHTTAWFNDWRSAEGKYLYEPGPSAMKAGLFHQYAQGTPLLPLAPNTHLYIGPAGVAFPGQSYKIEKIWPLSSASLKKCGQEIGAITKGSHVDVAVRNVLGLTPDQLTRRLNLTLKPSKALFTSSPMTDPRRWRLFGATDSVASKWLILTSAPSKPR